MLLQKKSAGGLEKLASIYKNNFNKNSLNSSHLFNLFLLNFMYRKKEKFKNEDIICD